MLKVLLFCCVVAASLPAVARPAVIDAARFGAKPDSGEDATPVLKNALREVARHPEGAVLRLRPGRYDFFPANAAKLQIFPSNLMDSTAPRTTALDLQNLDNLTIDGQGAQLVMHGKMTLLAAQNCKKLTLRNLAFDFAHPTVSEIRVLESGDNYWLGKVHRDSAYSIEDGKNLIFTGEDWRTKPGFTVRFQPQSTQTNFVGGNDSPLNGVTAITEVRPRVLRFELNRRPGLVIGDSFQFRNVWRENVGLWFSLCCDVRLDDVAVYANDGFAALAQQTENFTARRFFGGPRPSSGRTASAWADIFHFTLCKGAIDIRDSLMSHTHDDAINVQGINFQIKEQVAPNQVLVRFAHPQAWGFQPFFAGDELEFVRASSLLSFGSAQVAKAEMKTPKDILVTLDRPAPAGIVVGKDCVENVTWTPKLHVSNCRVEAVSTRGFLISTRQPVLIENNSFSTHMESILIADDANNWFESGPVRDITIRGNVFKGSGHPFISVRPEVQQGAGPVHRNIRIENNTFLGASKGDINLHWATNVRVAGNRFEVKSGPLSPNTAFVEQSNSTEVVVE